MGKRMNKRNQTAWVVDLKQPAAELVERLAANDKRRAKRAQRNQARLATHLPPTSHLVRALSRRGQQLNLRADAGITHAKRLTRMPVIKRHEWLVQGTVLDKAKSGVPGLQVRAFDLDAGQDQLLGVAQTDDLGDFAIIFTQKAFAATNERAPDIYVTVEDQKGQVLLSTRTDLRLNAGRRTHFLLHLKTH